VASPEAPAGRRRTDAYRTLRVVRSDEATPRTTAPRRKRRRGSPAGYAAAAAAGALAVAFGVLLGSRDGSPDPEARPARVARAVPAAASSPPLSAPPAPPASVPAAVAAADSTLPVATRRQIPKPGPVRARVAPVRNAPAEESGIGRCTRVEDTVFHATGMRPDAEFMRMKISVPPDTAMASVFFENGGDSAVLLDRLEFASAEGSLRPVSDAVLPARVPAGGLKEIYRYPLARSRGETGRRFVLVDRDGDSWEATLRLVPCGS
jgi:hypothetical protein